MVPLKILMVTSEVAPLAKTGGLADMVAGLSAALVELGHEVRIVFPLYASVREQAQTLAPVTTLTIGMNNGSVQSTIVERVHLKREEHNSAADAEHYAIRHEKYYGRRGLYQESGQDYPDNLTRFAFFCRASLALADFWGRHESWVPDVIHVHDWQTGLLPVYLKRHHDARALAAAVKTVMTLHNIGYQGIFPPSQLPALGLDESLFTPHGLEYYGSVNLLKGGILFADSLTTVSPTYCREVQTSEYGFGLDGVLRERRDRFFGIVNGIDTKVWDPATDPWLAANYSLQDRRGKASCKTALQEEIGCPVRPVPLFAVVSRLVSQKGIDLVVDAIPALVKQNAQLVVLGTGERELEAQLESTQRRFPSQVAVRIGYDEGLAHRIQAGADIFLVPSRYEPCGLTQLCSLRYGTVPIVRKTGGLADTIVGLNEGESSHGRATGVVFAHPTSPALVHAIGLALSAYSQATVWDRLLLNGMQSKVGWQESAARYVELYRETIGRTGIGTGTRPDGTIHSA